MIKSDAEIMKFNKKYYLVTSGKYEKYLEYINAEKNENPEHDKSLESGSKENNGLISENENDLKSDHPPKLSNELKIEQEPKSSNELKIEHEPKDTKTAYSQGIAFDKAPSSAFQTASPVLAKEKNIKRVIQFPPPGEPQKKKKKKQIENKITPKVKTIESTKKPISAVIKKWQSIK